MPPRTLVVLAIIAAIGVGTGAIVFGTLEIVGAADERVATIIAIGSMLTTGGVAALIAHIAGALNWSDEDC